MNQHKTIFKSAAAISLMVLFSRLTGFLRDVLIAGIFGTGVAAQAFFVAYRIPNVFRDIVGEGAGNAAFVPVFCEYLVSKPKQKFQEFANSLFLAVVAVSILIALAGILLSSPLIRVVAPGFLLDPQKLRLAVSLTRIIFPYLVLAAVSAYLMALANSLKSFALPASSSVVFNVVMIASLAFFIRRDGIPQIYMLAWTVIFAGLMQVLVQIPVFGRNNIRFERSAWKPGSIKEEGVAKVGRLIVPRLLGTSIYQMNVFVDTVFASLSFYAGEGAIAAIYYANRIIQFPFGVIGLALSNAALPQMSSSCSRKDTQALNNSLEFCLKALFLAMLPVMLGMLVFAGPLVQVIFQRGSFGAYSTSITSVAVFFYSLGLLSFSGARFLSHAFYAMQDTRTPVKTAGIALLLNAGLNALFIFVFRLKLAGLALASVMSASMNFYLLYRHLKAKTGFNIRPVIEGIAVKCLAASAASCGAAFFVWQKFFAQTPSFKSLLSAGFAAVLVYPFVLWMLDVKEAREFFIWLKKRK